MSNRVFLDDISQVKVVYNTATEEEVVTLYEEVEVETVHMSRVMAALMSLYNYYTGENNA